MGTLVLVLLTLVLGMLGLVLLVLSIPWFVSIRVSTRPNGPLVVLARPFAVGFPTPLTLSGRTDTAIASVKQRKRKKRKRTTISGPSPALVGRALRDAPILFFGIFKAFRVETLHISGTIGLDDPADTGTLLGVIFPLSHAVASPRVRIDVAPDFTRPVLDADILLIVRVQLVRSLPSLFQFGWRVFVRPK